MHKSIILGLAWGTLTSAALIVQPTSPAQVIQEAKEEQQAIYEAPNRDVTCQSKLFCSGDILRTIQLNQVLEDGKEFVDRPTKIPADQVIAAFKKLGAKPTKQQLKKFVEDNFHPAGFELKKVEIANFNSQPRFLKNITDPVLRGFAEQVHDLWSTLIRKTDTSQLCKGCESTIIETKHPFVVPGGRFKEFYYWDTFFSLEGMNLGELYSTSKDAIQNFLDIVDEYGFMPNGARKYYLNRSQPPMLIPMVAHYVEKTNDIELLKKALPILKKEYNYWINHHSVQLPCSNQSNSTSSSQCHLTRYVVNSTNPRPESYREDYLTVLHSNKTKPEQDQLYADLAAGAETGWDYSTRWVPKYDPKRNYTQEALLSEIETSNIIPVDLNSIMYMNEMYLSQFSNQFNQSDSAKEYKLAADRRAKLMEQYLWDTELKSFFDYNFNSTLKSNRFASSNYWPFWVNALTPEFQTKSDNYVQSFKHLEYVVSKYSDGQPATDMHSGLQWDYPNKWAPLEYVSVESLLRSSRHLQTKDPKSATHLRDLSLRIAQSYINDVFCGWYATGGQIPSLLQRLPGIPKSSNGSIFEKYGVEKIGGAGGGGEYDVQTGFGWTNGVLLHFLGNFPELIAPADPIKTCEIDLTKQQSIPAV